MGKGEGEGTEKLMQKATMSRIGHYEIHFESRGWGGLGWDYLRDISRLPHPEIRTDTQARSTASHAGNSVQHRIKSEAHAVRGTGGTRHAREKCTGYY